MKEIQGFSGSYSSELWGCQIITQHPAEFKSCQIYYSKIMWKGSANWLGFFAGI